MSIEQKLDELTAAVAALTAAVAALTAVTQAGPATASPAPAKAPETTKEAKTLEAAPPTPSSSDLGIPPGVVTPQLPPSAPAGESPLTYDDLLKRACSVGTALGPNASKIQVLLNSLGAQRLSGLEPGRYAEFMAGLANLEAGNG